MGEGRRFWYFPQHRWDFVGVCRRETSPARAADRPLRSVILCVQPDIRETSFSLPLLFILSLLFLSLLMVPLGFLREGLSCFAQSSDSTELLPVIAIGPP